MKTAFRRAMLKKLQKVQDQMEFDITDVETVLKETKVKMA
jgi:hypothetical protein